MTQAKYKWIKLQSDFFTQTAIKQLRRIAGGETFTIIYLKMQLLCLKNDGVIVFEGICDTLADELALVLDEGTENVQVTLNFLSKSKLIEEISPDEYLLPEAVRNIGSESASAERMRRLREKNKQLLLTPDASHCDSEVTDGDADVQNSDAHIRDKSKREIESKSKDINSPTARPSGDNQGEKAGKKIFADDSDEMKLSKLLARNMRTNDKKARIPADGLLGWCGHMEKLIRIDNRTPKEIQDMILFSQWHDFWKQNILSARNLRDKFGRLYLAAQEVERKNEQQT